jgi:hypothetical protein
MSTWDFTEEIMPARPSKLWPFRAGLTASLLLSLSLLAPAARGQVFGRPTTQDSSVGYIDDAIPGDLFRLRFDAADHFRRPTRDEFFYAATRPFGPGLPLPERRIDYQELTAYLEAQATDNLSGFVEVPWRFLEPEVNARHNGLGDLSAGFKWAFWTDPATVASFQLRAYAPTGDSTRGLGNNHVSLEPAFLLFHRLTEQANLEGELRYWVPVGGTDFAGDLIRYGIGANYDLFQVGKAHVIPVVELIGWTALSGKEIIVPPIGMREIKDAAGDSILNVKVGVRVRTGNAGDVYVGYGRALTGNRWYDNDYRVEWRLAF